MPKHKKETYRLEKSHVDLSPGETVAMLRELKDWTQEQLAKASGIAATNISQIENGHLTLEKQRAIALGEALDVHPATLLFPDIPLKKVA